MRSGIKNAGLIAGGIMAFASIANAQTVITQWNFNNGVAGTAPAPSTGTGVASWIGGVVAPGSSPFEFPTGNGSSDPATTGDLAWSSSGYPAQGTASGTAGMMFTADCTGRDEITFEFDMQTSTSASRWWTVEYSTNGVAGPWTAFTGMPFATNGTVAGGGSFGSNLNIGHGAPDNLTYHFQLPLAANNNANVACRITAVFDPAGSVYTAWRTPTPPTDPYATTGTMRVDMVEFRDNTPVSVPPVATGIAPSVLGVCQGDTTTSIDFRVAITAGANPTSASYTVTADLSPIGGSTTASMIDLLDGTWGVSSTVAPLTTVGIKTINFSVMDDQGRPASSSVKFGVGNCSNNATSDIVIAQIYGGGSSATSFYNQDYVVLYNRGCAPVDIANWSIQYGTAGGINLTQKVDLIPVTPATTIIIPPKSYYLVQTSTSTANATAPALPRTPDFTSNAVNMSGTTGRVAIVNSATLVANPVTDASVKDFVGYGAQAANYEGSAAAQTATIQDAYYRKTNGNQDSNENFNDFVLLVPSPLNSTDPVGGTCTPACPADLDNDGVFPGGSPDGGVDINDLLYFLAGFEAGSIAVDLDNDGDPAVGTPDGGTDINDLLFFLARFEGGC